jgi:UDP-glucose 4-epimerase
MERVVITGASGFLGRRLVSQLTGVFELVPVSRGSHAGMVQVANYANVPDGDLLIHLAEESDRAVASRFDDGYIQATADLTRTLSRRFAGRMIYASSGSVYGDDSAGQCYVGDQLVCADAYTRTKILGEESVLEVSGTVVRLANLYGPGMSKSNVMSDILRQIPGEGPILIRDDTPVRDFLAVDDAARLFALLAGTKVQGVLNAGSGVGTRISVLVQTALSLCGEIEREIVATRRAPHPSINVLNVEATKKVLGWVPSRSLAEHMKAYFFERN